MLFKAGLFFPALIIAVLLQACNANSAKKEKPADTNESTATAQRASAEEIEAGIRKHIDEKTAEGKGFFHVMDGDRELKLKLVRVHTEYISNLGPGSHFACVDLAEISGDVYDVDFFLEGRPGEMKVTRTSVHKLNGKPFYTWKQRPDKTWYQVPVEDASGTLLGVIEGEDEFDFFYDVTLPEIEGRAEVWLPLAQSDPFQELEIREMELPGKWKKVKDGKYGNLILYSLLGPEDSGKKIHIAYHVKRLEKAAYEDPASDPADYLHEAELIPVGGRFAEIAEDAIAERQAHSELTRARALYDYIIDNMEYKKAWKYGTGDANYACDAGIGNCTEFHSFFLSLARSAGIPARFAIGAAIPSARNEGGVDGYHCWAEFYAEGKWWPIDISEGNKYTPLATYYFGHHPANRIELSRGRDIRPDPLPASGPIHFFAYPVLEINGESVSVKPRFSFQRTIKKS